MEESAYLGELIAGGFYLVAGARLLRLAARTHENPERLLGLTFLLIGLSFSLYQVPIILGLESMWTAFNFAARVTYVVSAVGLALFTREVFRKDGSWATGLVAACALSMLGGVVFSALEGDWEGFSISNRWFWFEWAGYTLPFVWIGLEALLQYGRARRRVELDLCDPLVCNRYLLWVVVGVLQLGASLATLPQYAEYEAASTFSAWTDAVLGTLEMLTVVTIWLVFFPPSFYRSWVARAPAAPERAGGS